MEGEPDEDVLERALCAIAEARKMIEKHLANGPYLRMGDNTENDKKDDASPGLASDWVKDVKDSLRACIGTSIAIGAVKKALSSKAEGQKLNISVEIPEVDSKARWHDWWAVPQIMEKLPVRSAETKAT